MTIALGGVLLCPETIVPLRDSATGIHSEEVLLSATMVRSGPAYLQFTVTLKSRPLWPARPAAVRTPFVTLPDMIAVKC